jgi:hypothetical protein
MFTILPQILEQKIPASQVNKAYSDIIQIKKAANAFFMDNRVWPNNLRSLIEDRYLESMNSPFGTQYTLAHTEKHLTIRINTRRLKLANMLAGKIAYGRVSDTIVETSIGVPARSVVRSYFLARKAIDGCNDCNQLLSDIDVNQNNLNNIRSFQSKKATIKEANIGQATMNNLFAKNIRSQTARIRTINAKNVTGHQFRGNNFVTNQSSVNTNKRLLDRYSAQWRTCLRKGGCDQ